MQGICDRDRSVSAGRSQLLSDFPSLYVLLDDFQDIVGHREGDFDFRYHLSRLFPYVNNVHFCSMISDPVAPPYPPHVRLKSIVSLFHPCPYGSLYFVDQGTWLFCIEIFETLKVTPILNGLHHSYTCDLHHWSVIVLIDFYTPELVRGVA
jgi:hypothetical protein